MSRLERARVAWLRHFDETCGTWSPAWGPDRRAIQCSCHICQEYAAAKRANDQPRDAGDEGDQ